MAGTKLPPQAYTKEMLAEAYIWLSGQPSHIRDLATNADSLVSLFLKARRQPSSRPSSEAFKSDLKNLASNIRDFDEEEDPAPSTIQHLARNTVNQVEPQVSVTTTGQAERILPPQPAPVYASPAPAAPAAQQQAQSSTHKVIINNNLSQKPTEANNSATPVTHQLDQRSRQLVMDVQSSLNLSNEKEVLRMLISLGYDRIQQILPRG